MGAFFALIWGTLSLYNVACLGGGRYLGPAYLILLATVPLAVRHALTTTAFDLAWLLILLPAMLCGLFCGTVLERIRDLNRRIRRRNSYIEQLSKTGETPVQIALEPEWSALPLPGRNARFRFRSLAFLLPITVAVNAGAGLLGYWLLLGTVLVTRDWNPLIGIAIIFVVSAIYYRWIYLPIGSLIAYLARRCDSGHRGTLCAVALAASFSALGAFVASFASFGVAAGLPSPSLGVALISLFLLYSAIAAQAGPLGLMNVYKPPATWEAYRSAPDSTPKLPTI